MLRTIVRSNENRRFALLRKEAPTSIGGGGCHEYEEGKEITSFAIDHYRSFYHGELHLSECGYILTSDVIEGENGMETTLPEGEELCFLRWYEEETAREYWLR